MKTRCSLVFAVLALLLLALPSRAVDVVVTTAVDELDASSGDGTGISLREAIRDVGNSGGTITFDASLDGQEINLKPPSDPNGGPLARRTNQVNAVIDAMSLPNGVIIDGQKATTFFALFESSLTLPGAHLQAWCRSGWRGSDFDPFPHFRGSQ